MKKIRVIIAGLVCVSLTGCGSFGAGAGTGTGNNTNILGSILGDVLGAATDGQTIGNLSASTPPTHSCSSTRTRLSAGRLQERASAAPIPTMRRMPA